MYYQASFLTIHPLVIHYFKVDIVEDKRSRELTFQMQLVLQASAGVNLLSNLPAQVQSLGRLQPWLHRDIQHHARCHSAALVADYS